MVATPIITILCCALILYNSLLNLSTHGLSQLKVEFFFYSFEKLQKEFGARLKSRIASMRFIQNKMKCMAKLPD